MLEVVAVLVAFPFYGLPLFFFCFDKKKKGTSCAIYSVPNTTCGCVFEAVLICEDAETAIYFIYFEIVLDAHSSSSLWSMLLPFTINACIFNSLSIVPDQKNTS